MRVRAPAVAVVLLAVVALLVALATADRWLPAVDDVWPAPPEACSEPDPTTSAGCLTPTAQRLHDRTVAAFGPPGPGAPIRSATCWGERSGNPSSDHPRGRACDFFPTRPGTFPEGAERDAGWAVAQWLRDHADELDVRYVIWQGRIWSRGRGDVDGWGRPYSGGGVYDAADATGGHFDHVHVSVRG
jgi:hypothetical protein